ncbi:MAG: DMT family transporter [Halofilum sp. (in: g-proteobacteria)]|nr:DMT family transporter [Halofilum sp. (in: g-proteobacteria)]
MNAQQQLTGIGIALTGVLVLSPDALLIRLVDTDRGTLLFWRTLLQGLTLWAFLGAWYRGRLPGIVRAMGRAGAGATLVFALSTILFVSSITLTNAANTLFMMATAPLWAALISWLVLGERVARRTWAAIACALSGIVIIFAGGIGGGTLLGDLVGLGAALSLASQLTIARHARATNLVPALAGGTLLVAVLVGPVFAAPASVHGLDVLWLALLGVVVLPVAFGLLTLAPRYIPSPEVSLIMQLEAILGPLWVWLGVGEVPPAATFVGGAIVLATLTVHSSLGLRAQRRAAVAATH